MQKLIFFSNLLFSCRPLMSFSQGPAEKIYIQTDRNYYAAGETIYFKAYILSDQDTVESSSLFVELWDDAYLKLAEITMPVVQATSAGSITIPRALNNTQVFLRAYTDYTASQSDPFQFVKPVLYNRALHMLPDSVQQEQASPVFFPEGGSLVVNASNNVAFRAAENFKGTIRNNKGETVAEIKPLYKGMGDFFLTPVRGETYSCTWNTDGKERVFPLPLPVVNGIALHIRQSADSLRFDIDRGESSDPRLQQLKVQLMYSNEIAYVVELNLTSRSRYSYFIPLTEFRAGMAEIRVLDTAGTIVASRPVFINRHSQYQGTAMELIKKELGKRGENMIRLEFQDTTLQYVSVSITDAAYNESAGFSGLMASGLWITGKPASPLHYPLYTAEQLDLYMQTSGIAVTDKYAVPVKAIPVTNKNYQLSGTVKKGRKLYAGKDLLVGVRSVYTGKELFKVKTDEQGKFMLDGLIVYDEVLIHCRIPGKGVEGLSFELSLSKPMVSPQPDFFSLFKKIISETGSSGGETSRAGNASVLNPVSDDTLVFSDKSITLQEVVLNADKNTAAWKKKLQMEEKYVNGGIFSGYYGTGTTLDVLNDPETQFYRDLPSYLAAKLSGVNSRVVNGEIQLFAGNYMGFSGWGSRLSKFYLGNLLLDWNMMNSISLNEVALVKYVPRLAGLQGLEAGIAVYLKKPGDQGYWEKDRYQLQEKKFNGYPLAKEFTEPDYSIPEPKIEKDTRKTLLWRPYVPLDRGIAEIRFFNNDRTRKFRIVVEGMAADGSMVFFESIIE